MARQQLGARLQDAAVALELSLVPTLRHADLWTSALSTYSLCTAGSSDDGDCCVELPAYVEVDGCWNRAISETQQMHRHTTSYLFPLRAARACSGPEKHHPNMCDFMRFHGDSKMLKFLALE